MKIIMDKQKIIENIKTRVEFCVHDANTFIWVKCNKDFVNANERKEPLGGGNFFVLLASFSLLTFLAKINGFLDLVERYTENDIKKIKDAIKKLDGSISSIFRVPKPGEFKKTEKELVRNLLSQSAIMTKINADKFMDCWTARHKMVHSFNPVVMSAASYCGSPGSDYKELIEEAIERDVIDWENKFFDVHALNLKLPIIYDFIVEKVNSANDEVLAEIIKWLETN